MKICEGKKTFSSYALAEHALKRHNDIAMCVFYCATCHGFHTGTKAPKVTLQNRKKQRIRELTESELYEWNLYR